MLFDAALFLFHGMGRGEKFELKIYKVQNFLKVIIYIISMIVVSNNIDKIAIYHS